MDNVEKIITINQLKEQLTSYDYIGVKIAMGVATIDDYKEEIAKTEELRKKIRELEDTSTATTVDLSKYSAEELAALKKALNG